MPRRLTFFSFFDLYAARVAAILAGLCALCVFLYGAFLLGAVAHAAKQTVTQREAAKLTREISTLEGEYLSKTKVLTAQTARDMGFVAPIAVSTVRLDTPILTLNSLR
jgi:hypothetical protein